MITFAVAVLILIVVVPLVALSIFAINRANIVDAIVAAVLAGVAVYQKWGTSIHWAFYIAMCVGAFVVVYVLDRWAIGMLAVTAGETSLAVTKLETVYFTNEKLKTTIIITVAVAIVSMHLIYIVMEADMKRKLKSGKEKIWEPYDSTHGTYMGKRPKTRKQKDYVRRLTGNNFPMRDAWETHQQPQYRSDWYDEAQSKRLFPFSGWEVQ